MLIFPVALCFHWKYGIIFFYKRKIGGIVFGEIERSMMMQSTWLDKLERKFRKFSIPNLMNLILVGMAVVFLSDIFLSVQYGTTLSSYLYFSRNAIFHGEVWRILSFLFIPINSSPIWILFSMYFYWLIGSGLEREWGSFRFNVFYLCGAIGTIISG